MDFATHDVAFFFFYLSREALSVHLLISPFKVSFYYIFFFIYFFYLVLMPEE